jgi:hypothetical protein
LIDLIVFRRAPPILEGIQSFSVITPRRARLAANVPILLNIIILSEARRRQKAAQRKGRNNDDSTHKTSPSKSSRL